MGRKPRKSCMNKMEMSIKTKPEERSDRNFAAEGCKDQIKHSREGGKDRCEQAEGGPDQPENKMMGTTGSEEQKLKN